MTFTFQIKKRESPFRNSLKPRKQNKPEEARFGYENGDLFALVRLKQTKGRTPRRSYANPILVKTSAIWFPAQRRFKCRMIFHAVSSLALTNNVSCGAASHFVSPPVKTMVQKKNKIAVKWRAGHSLYSEVGYRKIVDIDVV